MTQDTKEIPSYVLDPLAVLLQDGWGPDRVEVGDDEVKFVFKTTYRND